MTLRRPVVAGFMVGAGTSTLAAALHATEIGRIDGEGPVRLDVLACRPDPRSLHGAVALATGSPWPRPVLAITGGRAPAGAGARAAVGLGTPDPLHAAATALRAHFGAVVLLPDVARAG